MLLAKGYPDIGWNPIEGERYLSFLRFAVFVNGMSAFIGFSLISSLTFLSVYSCAAPLFKRTEKRSRDSKELPSLA